MEVREETISKNRELREVIKWLQDNYDSANEDEQDIYIQVLRYLIELNNLRIEADELRFKKQPSNTKRLEAIIEEASKVDYGICHYIQDFSISDLMTLAEIAKNNDVKLRIFEERSNFAQGVLLEVGEVK